MRFIVASMVAAGLMAANSSLAVDMPIVAKKYGCNDCHAIDKKIVGPAWREISRKYKGDAAAKARLVTRIMKGSSGVWGAMPMPPNQTLSETDAGILADFVLGLAR